MVDSRSPYGERGLKLPEDVTYTLDKGGVALLTESVD